MKVYNQDIAQLVRRVRRFKEELIKSVSSATSELNDFDKNRLISYLDAIKAFKAWVVSQPQLDLPESSPTEIEISDAVAPLNVENDDLVLIVSLFETIEKEIVNSQSARRSTGLISHDSQRFDTYVIKIEKFVSDFVNLTSPLDLPESSPMVPVSGQGRLGV